MGGGVRAPLRTEALQDVCRNSLQTEGVADEIEDRCVVMVSQHDCGQRVHLRGEGTRQGCCEAGPEEVGLPGWVAVPHVGTSQRRW